MAKCWWLLITQFTFLFFSFGNEPLVPQPEKPPIKIGSTNNISLASTTTTGGINNRSGLEIYFARVNSLGGVQGQKLDLIALDDGYDPERAAANARQLINKDHVLALLAVGGTPTTLLILPIIDKMKTVLFAPFTGAEFLYKKPPNPLVFTFRASYEVEISSAIKGLLSLGIKPEEIAFFGQNDSFGDEIYEVAMKALKAEGYPTPEQLPYGQISRNSTNVEGGLATILTEMTVPPKAIILGVQKTGATNFINLAIKQFPHAIFFVTSAARDVEISELPKEATIIVTQILPYFDSNVPALKEYREDLKKYAPGLEPSSFSWATYISAKLFVTGLQLAAEQNKLTREGIVGVFESMHNVDIGIGFPISYSKDNHTGLNKVWFTQLKNGQYSSISWSDLKN